MLMSPKDRNADGKSHAVSCCDFDDEAKCPRARKKFRRIAKRRERQAWRKEEQDN